MINMLFLNSIEMCDERIRECIDSKNCNMKEVSTTIDALRKIKDSKFDAVLLASDFDDIDVELLIELIRIEMKYAKIIVLHDFKDEEEEKLYKLEIDNIINYKENEGTLSLKVKKFVNELSSDLKNTIIDTKTDIIIDGDSQTVKKSGHTIKMSNIEYNLLELLLKNKNEVLSRRQIEKNVWGNNISDFDSRVIDVYILKLRRKLDVNCIETVRGIGYVWRD